MHAATTTRPVLRPADRAEASSSGRASRWRSQVDQPVGTAQRAVSPTRPAGTTAGHEARLAVDRVATSYWAESANGAGTGQRLEVTFGTPVDVDGLGMLSGAPGAAFLRQPRPRVLRVRRVTWVRQQILTVYPGQTTNATAIREIELFRVA